MKIESDSESNNEKWKYKQLKEWKMKVQGKVGGNQIKEKPFCILTTAGQKTLPARWGTYRTNVDVFSLTKSHYPN